MHPLPHFCLTTAGRKHHTVLLQLHSKYCCNHTIVSLCLPVANLMNCFCRVLPGASRTYFYSPELKMNPQDPQTAR